MFYLFAFYLSEKNKNVFPSIWFGDSFFFYTNKNVERKNESKNNSVFLFVLFLVVSRMRVNVPNCPIVIVHFSIIIYVVSILCHLIGFFFCFLFFQILLSFCVSFVLNREWLCTDFCNSKKKKTDIYIDDNHLINEILHTDNGYDCLIEYNFQTQMEIGWPLVSVYFFILFFICCFFCPNYGLCLDCFCQLPKGGI